ncbi:DUF3786 domain-containing protein [Candidatus Solincola sp.]|jgi:hypothetical protein|nr:DUF3786 domain-containing protein [Actinomycetota bacterium]MDI7252850.1 DUF3786 domain-containing protein [Actinomycetota bacterium]
MTWKSEAEDKGKAAFRQALEELKELDLRRQAELGGFSCRELEGGALLLIIPSFNGEVKVWIPDGRMSVPPHLDSLSLRVLALRYVKLSCGVPESGEWIAYRDLPGGRFYAATLAPTIERPLADIYGYRRGALGEAAVRLGGVRADFGDESFVFHAFPRVPLLLVLHWGDEEFPPECRVLYDRCCSRYLNTDDLKVLATQLAAYLMKAAGEEEEAENLLWMVE